MLKHNIIRKSQSPFASPIVLTEKPDGSDRFCIDYRKLNEKTIKDSYPMPLIEYKLDRLGKSKYFSSLDLASGYWQIKMHPNSIEKTAFATHMGLYELLVMGFGLCWCHVPKSNGNNFGRLTSFTCLYRRRSYA